MSWFDATAFSKYAKTALKQAQKNIDKVLDITEEDANSTKLAKTTSGSTTPSKLASSPKSSSYVAKESDSFFETFLGNDLKKQVSNYLTPEANRVGNNVANVDAGGNDIVNTSQRRGRLKDRAKIRSTSSTPESLKSNEINDINESTPAKNQEKNSDNSKTLANSNVNLKYSGAKKEDLFDDIDLSDSDDDDDFNDLSSYISDESDIHSLSSQTSSLAGKYESGDIIGNTSLLGVSRLKDDLDIDILDDVPSTVVRDDRVEVETESPSCAEVETESPSCAEVSQTDDLSSPDAGTNANTNDLVDTSKRKGKLKDRVKKTSLSSSTLTSSPISTPSAEPDSNQNECEMSNDDVVDITEGEPNDVIDITEGEPNDDVIDITEGEPNDNVVDITGGEPNGDIVYITGGEISNDDVVDITGGEPNDDVLDIIAGEPNDGTYAADTINEKNTLHPLEKVNIVNEINNDNSSLLNEEVDVSNTNNRTVDCEVQSEGLVGGCSTEEVTVPLPSNSFIVGNTCENVESSNKNCGESQVPGDTDVLKHDSISDSLKEAAATCSDHNALVNNSVTIDTEVLLLDAINETDNITIGLESEEKLVENVNEEAVESKDGGNIGNENQDLHHDELHLLIDANVAISDMFEAADVVTTSSTPTITSIEHTGNTTSSVNIKNITESCPESYEEIVFTSSINEVTESNEESPPEEGDGTSNNMLPTNEDENILNTASSSLVNISMNSDTSSINVIDKFVIDKSVIDKSVIDKSASDSMVNVSISDDTSPPHAVAVGVAVESPDNNPLENIMKRAETQLFSEVESEVSTAIPFKNLPQSPYCHAARDVKSDDVQCSGAVEGVLLENSEKVKELSEKVTSLSQEVNELKGVIEAREAKMVEMSKRNISYQESVAIYKSQIEQLEQVHKSEDEEMETMRAEFTKRIAECDVKCQTALKERDQSKTTLIEIEASLRQSTNEQVSLLTNSLLEKEETIQDLLNEGEALSKKELESNQRIKKLRIKLKEVNKTNEAHTEKTTGFETEIQKLKDFIQEKESNESRLEDELKKLEGITDSQEDEVSVLKEKLDDMEEKYKTMESTLLNTYCEINRLHLENAQKDSAMQESNLAVQEKKRLEEQLKDLEKNSKFGKEELLMKLEDLQLAYSRLEQQLVRREDELKIEIEDLNKRLEHGEHRNQELSQSVSAATKPLLRQIANLQSNYTIQSDSWERIERTLTDRLVGLQDQSALAVEKERMASEVACEAKAKLKAVQTQQISLKDEKTNLQIALENEVNKCSELESAWKREKSNYETKLSKLKLVTMELEGEKKVLEEQLSMERIKYENETLRMSTQISLQQQRQSQMSSSPSPQLGNPSSRHSSRTSSISGDFESSPQDTSSPSNIPLQRYLSTSSSFSEGLQKGASTATAASVEHLKCQLRSREGEVFVLQEEIKGLEKTKASLAQELVNLSNNVEELQTSNEELLQWREEYKDLKSRYDAVLQMYGEKAEEAEELKMDIEDVKNMYRQQIQELCGGR